MIAWQWIALIRIPWEEKHVKLNQKLCEPELLDYNVHFGPEKLSLNLKPKMHIPNCSEESKPVDLFLVVLTKITFNTRFQAFFLRLSPSRFQNRSLSFHKIRIPPFSNQYSQRLTFCTKSPASLGISKLILYHNLLTCV